MRPPCMALLKTHRVESQPPSPRASLGPGELGAAFQEGVGTSGQPSGKVWGAQLLGTFPGEWPSAHVARVSRGLC